MTSHLATSRPFCSSAQKAEFCKADETETRAASREQRLPSGERAGERLSEATVVVAAAAVEERMAKVKPASSGVQWPQKETLYAATGCPACQVFEQIWGAHHDPDEFE